MSKLSTLKKEARRAEEREDFVEAIELYGRAVSVAQEDASATFEVGLYNRIGDLYLKLDDTSQAVYHYLLAVDQYADDGLYPPAIALCRKVLRVAPDQVDAYRKLARLHEATGLMADAREEMERYLVGLWEAGQVNGALEGLPELVARLMSGAPDLEEVRRLRDEGESEEAFELLYRQWEDDAAHWKNGNGNGHHADEREGEAEAAGEAGFPQTDPEDRSLSASLRRGWEGLFGGGDDADGTNDAEVVDVGEAGAQDAADETAAEDAPAASAEEREDAPADGDELDDVDDMAWLREVTGRRPADASGAEDGDEPEIAAAADETTAEEAVAAELEDEQATDDVAAEDEAADGVDFLAAAVEEPAAEEPAAEDVAAPADADAGEVARADDAEEEEEEQEVAVAPEPETLEEPEPAAAADDEAREEAVEAPVEEPEPAGPPAEVLVAAAASLDREPATRPALTGDVAAPMLLSAASADVPEGRTAVVERPVDRAVRARIRQRYGDRRPGGRPPEGPAFETPGREDYLPAGAEVQARAASPNMLWLSDQVALLGALDRREPIALKPAFGPPLELLRSAAEALESSATVEPVAALPSDVAAPALLGAGVAEEAWVAEPVVEDVPEPRLERRPPEGPAFETPGREDYLPAGAEIGARLPGAALSWLADAVDHLHRIEWGEPAWLEAAREMKAQAAAAMSELAADVEPRAALPANLGRPLLLAPAREEAETGDAVVDAEVEEISIAAEEIDVTRPAAAAQGAGARPSSPDGPSYQTPGREDYLPAGAELADGLPSPALAWLAASVADIHRLDGGEPAWFDTAGAGLADGTEAEEASIRLDGFDPSEEDAARATRDALALIAAEEAAAPTEPEVEEAGEAVPEQEVAEAEDETEVVEAEAEQELVEVAEAEDDAEARADEAIEVDVPRDATETDEAAAGSPAADDDDRAEREEAGEPAAAPVEEPTDEPEPAAPDPRPAAAAPSVEETPFHEPGISPPVEQPAVRPNGLDFTALLQRIGWLRGEKDGTAEENGSAAAADGDWNAVRPGTDDAVLPPWAKGPSSGSDPAAGGSGPEDDGPGVKPPKAAAPGSGVPDFTELLQKVGWLHQDERP